MNYNEIELVKQELLGNGELRAESVTELGSATGAVFGISRTTDDGRPQYVTVRFTQTGVRGHGWELEVTADDGRSAIGNGSDDLSWAIDSQHWKDLG